MTLKPRAPERLVLVVSASGREVVGPALPDGYRLEPVSYDRLVSADLPEGVAGAVFLLPKGAGGADDTARLPAMALSAAAVMERLWRPLQRVADAAAKVAGGGQIVLELPAAEPWRADVPLEDVMVQYALIGLLRAVSADDGRDNIRFNGFCRSGAPTASVDALLAQLLVPTQAAPNGQVFVLAGDTLALAGQEAARWLTYCDASEPGWQDLLLRHMVPA